MVCIYKRAFHEVCETFVGKLINVEIVCLYVFKQICVLRPSVETARCGMQVCVTALSVVVFITRCLIISQKLYYYSFCYGLKYADNRDSTEMVIHRAVLTC